MEELPGDIIRFLTRIIIRNSLKSYQSFLLLNKKILNHLSKDFLRLCKLESVREFRKGDLRYIGHSDGYKHGEYSLLKDRQDHISVQIVGKYFDNKPIGTFYIQEGISYREKIFPRVSICEVLYEEGEKVFVYRRDKSGRYRYFFKDSKLEFKKNCNSGNEESFWETFYFNISHFNEDIPNFYPKFDNESDAKRNIKIMLKYSALV